jgi:hypothetical protein
MSWITLDDIVALYLFLLDHRDVSGPVNGVARSARWGVSCSRASASSRASPWQPGSGSDTRSCPRRSRR